MTDDTLTLNLGGDAVPFGLFVQALAAFNQLVDALSNEVSPNDAIEWTIADLNYSSAVATVRGHSRASRSENVYKVIEAYALVGKHLEQRLPVPFPESVAKPALRLANLPGEKVPVVRFITANDDAELRQTPVGAVPVALHRSAYGLVEGRVQTLTETRGLRFVLYETLSGRPVSCYLREQDRESMRGIWGRRAAVEGYVTRDRVNGAPVTVRKVQRIQTIPETDQTDYQTARGVLPRMVGEPSPEDRIRAVRDAE